MSRALAVWVLLAALAPVPVATAQTDAGVDAADAPLDPQAEAFRRAIDSDPWTSEESDPLSSVGAASLEGVTDDPDVEEVEAPVPVRHGEIVEAIAGVRESRHELAMTLEGGLAVVTETMHFQSRARHRAEVMERLAVPPGAVLVALRVENASGARDGLVTDAASPQGAYDDALLVRSTTPSARPVAHVRAVHDAHGDALVVRAAPVGTGNGGTDGDDAGALTVTLTWAVAVPMHGGVARLTIPARGNDDRAAAPTLAITAADLVEPRVDGAGYERGPIDVHAGSAFVVTALAPLSRAPRVDASIVPCGGARCAVLRAFGARARVSAAPIVVAIDASPSTTIGARGRIADAIRVVSAMLPRTTPVRWIAFASGTLDLGRGAPSELDLARVRTAVDAPLGSATRFSALWNAVQADLHAGDRVLVVGDGGLTSGASETAAWDAARARGVVVSALDLADRPPMQALADAVASTGGVMVAAGAEADRAAGGHGDDALTELVSAAIADRVGDVNGHVDARAVSLGTLRTGESALFVGPAARADLSMASARVTAAAPDAAHALVLSALASHVAALVAVDPADLDAAAGACAPDGSARARATTRASSIVGHGVRVAPAHRRACASTASAPVTAPAARGLPARVLRDQLRRRVIPPARGCFRDDRRGRASLHREVAFDLVLADREIVSVGVDGDIPDTLRICLLRAFDDVEVPAFDGTLAVRWPLHTEVVLPPPSIELAPDVAREVREIAGDAPIPTTPSLP